MSECKLGLGTRCLHAGQEVDSDTGSRAVPIYQTTSYVFRDSDHAARLFDLEEPGFIYTRIMNPTVDVFEKRMAALDGGVGALAFSSGSSAITFAILNITSAGQNIVSTTSLYGGTVNLFKHTLKRMGIEVRFVDPADPENFHRAIDENTRLCYVETIGNPKNDVPSFEAIASIAHEAKIPLFCDDTVATPALWQPFEHGVDIACYSCTKFIGGHGTSIAGCVVDSGKFDWSAAGKFGELTEPDPSYHGLRYTEAAGEAAFITRLQTQLLRDIGACISPFNAFLLLQGIETLHLRMPRHCENALGLARWLAKHPAIKWVNYPFLKDHPSHDLARRYLSGGGGMIGFGIAGGKQAGKKFIDSVQLASHLANIGDAKTLVIHPASTTHRQLSPEAQLAAGVTEDYVRVSAGLEDLDDLLADFDQALAKSQE